ncbi:dihydrolipoyl dehydrogenase [Nitratireductor sp. CAU 1489]|uniref:Dihydrolipoyl dehydrogenase n=1 Tax=Nitratireductor arenosus TaxID=2682096 RepID=A0A844QKG4_9HYPH|nr:dihydrolipoyl dehydrogenase [Nitratireductor arenosus]MVA98391.1 dihydrolipoyl dehydrogenase [Nitratireductor arenosus]
MRDIKCQLLVIGAGPGGYVCAIRAGQLGIDTVIVEAEKPGGTCLNVGCIPSKALIHAADEFAKASAFAGGDTPLGIQTGEARIDYPRTLEWKDGIVHRLTNGVSGLLKKAGVKHVDGWARFRDGKTVHVDTATGTQTIEAEQIVIATGSNPVELPGLPFGGDILSSTGALALTEIPKSLAVVGAGYIGLELGTAFAKLGSQVSVLEAMDRILPAYDEELTRPVKKRLEALGVTVLTGVKAERHAKNAGTLSYTNGTQAGTVPADAVLVTVGRAPATEGWGLEELDLTMDGRFIAVDDQCRTSMRGVHAVGDVTGEPMLAHRAMAQGEMVAEIIAGKRRAWDRRCVPAVCFTDPEIVSAGLSPQEAAKTGLDVRTASFPLQANGRAMTIERDDGFVRIVARADNHLVVGVQAAGSQISELASYFAHAIEMGARLEDVAQTIHAHPTLGESFQEAALRTLGHALHI